MELFIQSPNEKNDFDEVEQLENRIKNLQRTLKVYRKRIRTLWAIIAMLVCVIILFAINFNWSA